MRVAKVRVRIAATPYSVDSPHHSATTDDAVSSAFLSIWDPHVDTFDSIPKLDVVTVLLVDSHTGEPSDAAEGERSPCRTVAAASRVSASLFAKTEPNPASPVLVVRIARRARGICQRDRAVRLDGAFATDQRGSNERRQAGPRRTIV